MRVDQLGEGEPELAIVGGIHGDEPCGVRAVERLMDERPVVDRPVKLVIANEAAVESGVRYLEADLNRSFPGDREGPTHESRLAADLAEELAGTRVLALHSTQSHPEPFAFLSGVDEFAREVVPRLPVVAAVDAGDYVEGRLFVSAGVVEVECGYQGSAAATENAHDLVEAFLAATGALGERPDPRPVPLFRLTRPLPKPPADEYTALAGNFERVGAGDPYATADGRELTADEPFWPVLLSANGYEDVFGYAADRVGELPE